MNIYYTIGEHRKYKTCRFCSSKKIESIIDLGIMPLAGGFFKKRTPSKELINEKFYPLLLNYCSDCFLLQVDSAIDAEILFKNYFYFSSTIKTLVDHFHKHVNDLKQILPDTQKRFIIEIGCNDGSMIKSFLAEGFRVLGIDPASNVVKSMVHQGLPILNAYFTESLAKQIVKKHGKADAIYSFHTLAHIEDMHDVIKGISHLLKNDGFLAMEVHYLGTLIKEMQYDMIYHEHQFYYSLLSLKNFFTQYNMEIFDIQYSSIRAGSMMYFVQKKSGKRKITKAVKEQLRLEKKQGLHKAVTYKKFAKKIEQTKKDLLNLLRKIKSEGKTIAGYGASGRGTIIMNYCQLDKAIMDYVIDDAPAKHGAITPGIHYTIYPSSKLYNKDKPDYAILFAWPFTAEVVKKHQKYLDRGGKFIVPLPNVRIIEK